MTATTRTALAAPEPTGGGRMAGHRRAVNGRTTTRPTQLENKQRRRRLASAARMGQAHGPTGRVGAVSREVLAALKVLARRNPRAAELIADQLVADLRATAARVWTAAKGDMR